MFVLIDELNEITFGSGIDKWTDVNVFLLDVTAHSL